VKFAVVIEVSTAIMDLAVITLGEDMAPTDMANGMATDMATDMATGISTVMVMDLVMEDLISDAEVNLNESLANEKMNVNHL
jgi:hypothetical protein